MSGRHAAQRRRLATSSAPPSWLMTSSCDAAGSLDGTSTAKAPAFAPGSTSGGVLPKMPPPPVGRGMPRAPATSCWRRIPARRSACGDGTAAAKGAASINVRTSEPKTAPERRALPPASAPRIESAIRWIASVPIALITEAKVATIFPPTVAARTSPGLMGSSSGARVLAYWKRQIWTASTMSPRSHAHVT